MHICKAPFFEENAHAARGRRPDIGRHALLSI